MGRYLTDKSKTPKNVREIRRVAAAKFGTQPEHIFLEHDKSAGNWLVVNWQESMKVDASVRAQVKEAVLALLPKGWKVAIV